ncbi:MAG: hypothetical protein HC923_07155 [Myxococcales bacterium]|nr:hypothetical protein [Myxococcales bacterium]
MVAHDEAVFGRPPESLPMHHPAPPTRAPSSTGLRTEAFDFTRRRDRIRFLDIGDVFYRKDRNYISPLRLQMEKFLNPAKNPAFEHLEVRPIAMFRNGKAVGRLTVQVDSDFERHNGRRIGFFGFFESVDERGVAHLMLDEGLAWLKERGCVEVLGPANFNLTHQAGLLVKNFDRPPFVEELYNPPLL